MSNTNLEQYQLLRRAAQWVEEAIGYVNHPARSPSLEQAGHDLLRRLNSAVQAAERTGGAA